MARPKHFPGPSPMCAQGIRTEWVRLDGERNRCSPGSDAYWAITKLMEAMSEAHRVIDGRSLVGSSPPDRCGPGPTWAKTGLG
jgi:hypothetical protein